MDERQKLIKYNEELEKILNPKSDGYVENATLSEARLIALARSMSLKEHDSDGDTANMKEEHQHGKKEHEHGYKYEDENENIEIGHTKFFFALAVVIAIVAVIASFAIFPARFTQITGAVKNTAEKIFLGHESTTASAIQGVNGEKVISTGNAVGILVFDKIEDIGNAVQFQVLQPSYLPEGYVFEKAETYKGSDKYLALFYHGPDGKQLIIIQTHLDKDTPRTFATGKNIENTKVNGHDAVYKQSSDLVWNLNNVRCELSFNGLDRKEAFKIAESIK